jgi:asparagine synthase (glutamine-hydrolysing)
MLSAGFDSRTLLAGLESVDRCFTVGDPDGAEAVTARRLASQYGASHTVFEPDERYLRPGTDKVRYSQGVYESLHIHHAGYVDRMGVEEMFHGLWYDTLLRGHFLPRRSVSALGRTVPIGGLDPDPDPVAALLDTLPYRPEESRAVARTLPLAAGDPDSFVRDAVATEFDRHADRADRVANRIAVTGVSNSPAITFHHHLADNFREWFVAVDRTLLAYHLTTPPEFRSTETFRDACRRLDSDLLDVRPPGRPYDSPALNALDGFARRVLPGAAVPGRAWPDRNDRYEAEDLDELLFPGDPAVRALSPRHKLRLHDLRTWLAQAGVTVPTGGPLDLGGPARTTAASRPVLPGR